MALLSWRKVTGIVLLLTSVAWSTVRASDEVFAGLVQRGLLPWPEAFLAELPFEVGSDSAAVLWGVGYTLRLPRRTPAKMALVAIPGRIVIVDILPTQGPVALSAKALAGLQIEAGAAPVRMQILALRPARDAPKANPAGASARVEVAPVPRPRPVREGQQERLEDTPVALTPEQPALAAPDPAWGWSLLEQQGDATPPVPEHDEQVKDDSGVSFLDFLMSDTGPDAAEPDTSEPAVEAEASEPEQPEPSLETVAVEALPENALPENAWTETQGRVERSSLGLQVGLFGNNANARRLAEQLEANDLPVVIRQITNSRGEPRWKVMAGPFADETTRRRVLGAHSDGLLRGAYPVTLD